MSKEQIIREVAYGIWKSEGQPEGQDTDHWARAQKQVEEPDISTLVPKKSRSKKSSAIGQANL